MRIYVAEFYRGAMKLFSVEVKKETKRTYTVLNETRAPIFGYVYYTKDRYSKTNDNVFETKQEALAWLLREARRYANELESQIYHARKTIQGLEDKYIELGEDAHAEG